MLFQIFATILGIGGTFLAAFGSFAHVHCHQPKSLYISHAVRHFYGREFEIWDGFGMVDILKTARPYLHLKQAVGQDKHNETKVGLNSNLMIPDFPDDIRIRLARLKLYHEESLVSSYLNSNLFWFHCVRPNLQPHYSNGVFGYVYLLDFDNFRR